MSLFRHETFACPECTTGVEFEVAESLNADRRPDLRAAILDGTYQRGSCPACGTVFRIDPSLTYLDLGRGQWILVLPLDRLGEWAAFEQGARAMFDRSFGPTAPLASRQIGERLSVRVTFGWAGLREKLLCAEHAVRDGVLETVKAALLRAGAAANLSGDSELRLWDVADGTLVLGWLRGDGDAPGVTLRVPRELYDSIAGDPAWRDTLLSMEAGPFVDVNRLLVPEAVPEPLS
jgi:hypothetical protein